MSPNDMLAVQVRRDGVALLDLETGREDYVALPFEIKPDEFVQIGNPVWSPDNQHVAFTIAYEPCSDQWRNSIVFVDAETLTARTLVEKDARRLTTSKWTNDGIVLVQQGLSLPNSEEDTSTLNPSTGEVRKN